MSLGNTDATVVWQPTAMASLVVEGGPQAGASFPLRPGTLIIGRGEASDIVLQDPMTSRRHARIHYEVGSPAIEDLGSSNGTFVNNAQVAGLRTLRPGDRILVGQTLFLFQVGDGWPEPPPAPTQIRPSSPIRREAIPARLILAEASRTNQRLGHENLGFLSESHGIMPANPPALRLPTGYEAWDETAAALPELYRTLQVRPALQAMPVLSAAEADLPDTALLRASCIMSMLAHSYYRIEATPPDQPLPQSIQLPWQEIARRLNRPAPHLSYIDLIMYNWRLVDPDRPDPMRVDNLRLLVPTVDNAEERIFYLTQVEILAQCTPVIGALVRAQEAVERDDPEALKAELALIAEGMGHVTFTSFVKIDPNRYSHTYVDPVVWAKTVAPFAVPIQPNVAGPSGTSAPIFHLLDVFFGRERYDSRFGAEMIHLREWYPRHWQALLDALGEMSVLDYLARRGDPRLEGLYKEAIQAYVGNSGFLSRHRLKVYGYLDIAFKVGRSVTITGFTGLFKDRTWDQVDGELAGAREERARGFPQASHYAPVKSVEPVNPAGDPERWVRRVVLDVSETGLRYQPGDRCAVLPENGDDLVDRTLAALKARGYESIPLTAEWREAVALRDGYQVATALPLRTLLRFGRIRPVERQVAKALYAASLNADLRRIIEARAEDQWELWDLLEVLSRAGFDPRRLWKAHPGQREHICRVVPPETFRMYSISSCMREGSELDLTVGRLLYQTRDSQVSAAGLRLGTASHFLGERSPSTGEEAGRVSLRLVRPPRFNLPADPSTPIVMFAGGTGIGPFRGFIQERSEQPGAGESWLFFSTRTRGEFFYQAELERLAAAGRLHVQTAFSGEAIQARFVPQEGYFVPGAAGGRFVFESGEKRRIGEEMLREGNAQMLWDLLRSRQAGGQGAFVYVCGRTGFASSVMAALKEVLRRFSPGSDAEKEAQVHEILYRMAGEGRYMQDIFTTYTAPHPEIRPAYDASEIVVHNDEEAGYWLAINGRVYDVTEFAHLHPGGFQVIRGYTGMDATRAYQKVLHHANPEVDSQLGMYEIGAVRRLDFGMEWGVAIGPRGLQVVTLADAYRTWVRFLYTLAEMENALHNDFTLQARALTREESPTAWSPLKLQFMLEVHDRFLLNYVEGSMGQPLEDLWAVTAGLCAPDEDARWMRRTIEQAQGSPQAGTLKGLSRALSKEVQAAAARGASDAELDDGLARRALALLEVEDKRFLREMKMALRAGVQVFERYERETLRQGGPQLLEITRSIPHLLEAYQARVLSSMLELYVERDA